jgi:hypothetical protein
MIVIAISGRNLRNKPFLSLAAVSTDNLSVDSFTYTSE